MAQGTGLDKETLKTNILNLFKSMREIKDNSEAEEKYASELSNIIEEYVKSGMVVTTGTAASQTGFIK